MRIVVTGVEGQLARTLAERGAARDDVDVVCLGRPEVDLTDPAGLARALEARRPDVVVNAAAYTAVDAAETEPALAFAVNRDGARAVARAAAISKAPVIQISTDYVFDGQLDRPYLETDPTAPLGIYGQSKLAGELAVRDANPRALVLRVAWVFSAFGKNFVKTMLRLSESRPEVGVVADQIGRPTAASAIADAVFEIAPRLRDGGPAGVFHFSGGPDASWADFAAEIFATASKSTVVKRITTPEYPTPAQRPMNSRLDGAKLAKAYGVGAADWQADLRACIERLAVQS